MYSHNLAPGSRVRDRIWAGIVTGVDADGTITVQWDSAQFTEHQLDADQVDTIPGTGDPTPRYAVLYDTEDTPAARSATDEDTDSM